MRMVTSLTFEFTQLCFFFFESARSKAWVASSSLLTVRAAGFGVERECDLGESLVMMGMDHLRSIDLWWALSENAASASVARKEVPALGTIEEMPSLVITCIFCSSS
ncbi:hypothetical protein BDY19DRAFT_274694 [Irpex rosettiformis]|uniref:Uncharacterized protein n=1 Tax=Irpex rosettiformis TaxID=378272 RepID=A0ACB8UI77_9APHY|nr:hypothetical protein BDY19DRAFT_274694 [Irpex rosettiformis]